jgi:hypothetical protein
MLTISPIRTFSTLIAVVLSSQSDNPNVFSLSESVSDADAGSLSSNCISLLASLIYFFLDSWT